MKLYVCWGTFKAAPRPGGHPCGNAHEALVEAGWDPEVERVYGWGVLGSCAQPHARQDPRAHRAERVPVLVTDDGEVIQDSKRIVAWAKDNPASGADAAS